MNDLAPDLVVTADGPVRLTELNRPEQRNAASEPLHTALAVPGTRWPGTARYGRWC